MLDLIQSSFSFKSSKNSGNPSDIFLRKQVSCSGIIELAENVETSHSHAAFPHTGHYKQIIYNLSESCALDEWPTALNNILCSPFHIGCNLYTIIQLSLVKYILHVKSNRNGSFESITLVITLEPFVHTCIDFELEVVGFISIFFYFFVTTRAFCGILPNGDNLAGHVHNPHTLFR